MSNVIGLNQLRQKLDEEQKERQALEMMMSNPMKAIYMDMLKQALTEGVDNYLYALYDAMQSADAHFTDKESLDLYKFQRDLMQETCMVMDYVIDVMEANK